jgi:tetraacyldisaccharide 4'-kinase
VYARAATWRRAWYARHPEARRRLAAPVISVGNLAVGGSGKTPVVATLARWLLAKGARPAILTRGYARRRTPAGVVVVSDGDRVLEPVSTSGDEPQMLARALRGVPVLVSADRYLAGRLAERHFHATVHILDDGFQHFGLERNVDLLLVRPDDLDDAVLPGGRLREPLAAARAADAILVHGTDEDAIAVSARLGVATSFRVATSFGAARLLEPFGALLPPMTGMRALAVAGIARPGRFFDAARRHGWDVVKELAFRDHHWFDAADLKRMLATARGVNADVILTTEKDAMRLLRLPLAPIPRTFAYLPMTVAIEPAAHFYEWLSTFDLGAGSSDVEAGLSRPPNRE